MLAWLKGRLQDLAVFLAGALNRFIDWLFASRNPAVVFVRETIRRNYIFRVGARAIIRTVRALPMLREWFGEFRNRRSIRQLRSIVAGRGIGGAPPRFQIR